MTIDITSSFVLKPRYEPIATGYFRGIWALQAQIGAGPCSAEHVVEIFRAVLSSPILKARRKIARFTIEGSLSSEQSFYLESLASCLRDYGFEIHFVYDGFNYIPALRSLASWVVAKSSALEMPHGGNEIWYIAPEGKPLADPIMPVVTTHQLAQATLLYLSAKGRDDSEILEFLSRSKYQWSMML